MLKQLFSIDDVDAEKKYGHPIKITPTYHCAVYSNNLPIVKGFDRSIWNRIRVWPFKNIVPEAEDIQRYDKILVKECGGAILQWAIDGAREFYNNGCKFDLPEAVERETKRYRRGQVWAAPFLQSDRVDTSNPNAKARGRDLFNCYHDWAETNNVTPHSEAEFVQAMRDADFVNKKPGNVSTWYGIQIVPTDTELEVL